MGDLRQSVPQNGRVHVHIIDQTSPEVLQISQEDLRISPKVWLDLPEVKPSFVGSLTPSDASCGPYPQYGWDFPEEIPEKFRKDPGNALRAFPGSSLESTAGMPQTL